MDKIKTVKIKNIDGSISQETYTIAVDAKNVDMLNSKDVQETIGNINVDKDGSIENQLDNLKRDFKTINSKYDSENQALNFSFGATTELDQDVKSINGYKINDEKAKKRDEKITLIAPKNIAGTNVTAGDIFILKSKNKTVLIDTHSDRITNDVYNFLDRNNVEHIDYVILTHYHSDHVANFKHLVNSGYIDSNSYVYLPGYSSLILNDQAATNLYNSINAKVVEENIPHATVSEGYQLKFDDVKITFYNCDESIFIANNYTGYNDCSTVVKIEYGSKSLLMTGDIVNKAINRFVDSYTFDNKIDIYKIGHHGNEASSYETKLLKQITPDIVLLPAEVGNFTNNNITQAGSLMYCAMKNIPVYSSHNNTNDIIIDIYKDMISVVSGRKMDKVASRRYEQTFYVDASTTNIIQDGSAINPFKDLPQAIASIDVGCSKAMIYLADGDYSVGDNTKYNSYLNNVWVEIYGNSLDNTKVKIHRTLFAYNKSNILLKDLSLYNDVGIVLQYYNSIVKCDNCIFTNTESSKSNSAIAVNENGMLILENCNIDYADNGVSLKESDAIIKNTSFNNVNNGIRVQNSTLKEINNVFSNVSGKNIFDATGSANIKNSDFIKKYICFDGNIYNQSEPFSLSTNVLNYNCLLIVTGVAGSNTLFTSVLLPYSSFSDNTIFNVQTLNGIGTLQFTNNGNEAIWTGSNSLRKIYGINIPNA